LSFVYDKYNEVYKVNDYKRKEIVPGASSNTHSLLQINLISLRVFVKTITVCTDGMIYAGFRYKLK